MANKQEAPKVEPQFVSVRDLANKFGVAGKAGEKSIRRILRDTKVKLANGEVVSLNAKTVNARGIYTFKQGSKLLAYVESVIELALSGNTAINDVDIADDQN